MTAPTLTEFEQAVLTRLRTQLQSAANPSGPLRTVEAYGDQFEQWLEGHSLNSPVALVHIAEGQDEPFTMRRVKRSVTLTLYLAVQNLRGQLEARQGVSEATEIGSYGLIELAFDLFAGQKLGLEIAPLLPGEWGSLTAPEDVEGFPFSLYRYQFRTTWTKDWPDDALGDEARGPAAAAVPDHVTSRLQPDLDGDDTADIEAEHTHEEP